MNNLIEAKKISKIFYGKDSEINALDNIDLSIKPAETLGILGISGSGKSTLLHILGTLDRPTSGEVIFDGMNLFNYDDDELSEVRNNKIGFVFQFHYLLQDFDALENVMIPCLINGQDKDTAKEKSIKLLEKVGLANRIYHKPGELSGGEQQRVAIARAVVQDPKVILADEPTGNLDLKNGMSILDLFLELNHDRKITCLIITHNKEIANRLERTVTLSDGKFLNVN